MRFNFPKQEDEVLVHIKLKPTMFEAIKDIAEKEECIQADAITILLETAIGEYYKQSEPLKKKDTQAYSLPATERDSPANDIAPRKSQESLQPPKRHLTEEEKAEKKKAYQREYMREYMRKRSQQKKQLGSSPSGAQPGKQHIKDSWQTKVDNHRQEENTRLDTSIGDNVRECPNDPCVRGGKFIVGTGYTEEGTEYCSKTCLDVAQSNALRTESLAPEYIPAN